MDFSTSAAEYPSVSSGFHDFVERPVPADLDFPNLESTKINPRGRNNFTCPDRGTASHSPRTRRAESSQKPLDPRRNVHCPIQPQTSRHPIPGFGSSTPYPDFVPPSISKTSLLFFLGKPFFAGYPQSVNRFRRVFNMDVHSLSTRIPFGHRRRRTLAHPPLGTSPFLPFVVLIFPPCRIRRLALSARLFHHQPFERAVREISHFSSFSSPISSSSSSSSSSVL